MPGRFLFALQANGRLAASMAAVAIALGSVAVGTPAMAQQGRQAQPSYSPEFVALYQPLLAIANATAGDFAAGRGQVPGLVAAARSADERFAAGNVLANLGTKLADKAMQRQGLEMMLASGKVAPAQLGQIQFFIGGLAYEARDFAAARTALQAAQAAGYQDTDLAGLLAEAHFNDNQGPAGLEILKQAVAQRRAAGAEVPEGWLRRALQVAYQSRLAPEATEWAAQLAASGGGNATNWTQALQVVGVLNDNLDAGAQLDLLRLMMLTGAMTQSSEFVRYVDLADPRVMSNEVSRVLQAGVAAGKLATNDPVYQDRKRVADPRMAQDRADAPRLAAEARRSGNGNDALNAGDVLYSLGSYADAEEMYRLAVEKGGADKNTALTRLGIAQTQQGKHAEAKANFAQVTGARAPVAQMWHAYATSKG